MVGNMAGDGSAGFVGACGRQTCPTQRALLSGWSKMTNSVAELCVPAAVNLREQRGGETDRYIVDSSGECRLARRVFGCRDCISRKSCISPPLTRLPADRASAARWPVMAGLFPTSTRCEELVVHCRYFLFFGAEEIGWRSLLRSQLQACRCFRHAFGRPNVLKQQTGTQTRAANLSKWRDPCDHATRRLWRRGPALLCLCQPRRPDRWNR